MVLFKILNFDGIDTMEKDVSRLLIQIIKLKKIVFLLKEHQEMNI
jgi:hypothetical protein